MGDNDSIWTYDARVAGGYYMAPRVADCLSGDCDGISDLLWNPDQLCYGEWQYHYGEPSRMTYSDCNGGVK